MPIFLGRAWERNGDGSIGEPLDGVQIGLDGSSRHIRVTTSNGGTCRTETFLCRIAQKNENEEPKRTALQLGKEIERLTAIIFRQ